MCFEPCSEQLFFLTLSLVLSIVFRTTAVPDIIAVVGGIRQKHINCRCSVRLLRVFGAVWLLLLSVTRLLHRCFIVHIHIHIHIHIHMHCMYIGINSILINVHKNWGPLETKVKPPIPYQVPHPCPLKTDW